MGNWELLLRWTFDGSRFEDHGVELRDLRELSFLRDALVELAKELWRAEHPDRERLPKNFEQELSLKFFAVEPGSAAIPVMYAPQASQLPLAMGVSAEGIGNKLVDAAALMSKALVAVNAQEPLPRAFPKHLLPKLELLGSSLAADERVLLDLPDSSRAIVTETTRERLKAQSMLPWPDAIDVVGEVTAASLRGKATVQVDGTSVEINFTDSDEKLVTEALFRHERLALRIVGRAEFAPPRGELKRITQVDALSLVAIDRPVDVAVKPIWQLATEIGAGVDRAEWASVPQDGSKNVDRYLEDHGEDGGGS